MDPHDKTRASDAREKKTAEVSRDVADSEAKDASNELSFEEALSELEQVVTNLQRSDLTLDNSLQLFQRGNYLVQICRRKLDQAEQEVKILLADSSGQEVEEDFLQPEEGGSHDV